MSSAANSQLLSAALTSARHSAARAGAHLPRVVATAPLAGVTSLPNTEAHDDEEDLPLSSRARRRSRASRFGSMTGENETEMPGRLVDATRQWVQDAPKALKHNSRIVRSAHPHLLSAEAAVRYAVLSQVLSHVADRLGNLGPASPDGQEHAAWTPEHVQDVNCAAGEGLWAAHAAWPQLKSYAGADPRAPLIRAATDTLRLARAAPASPSSAPYKVKASFKTTRTQHYTSSSESQDVAEHVDQHRTLFLAPYALSDCSTDGARSRLVQEAWNKGAHVLVFIEKGDERGFACIASAREELLALGRGQTGQDDSDAESLIFDGKRYFAEPSPDKQKQKSGSETAEGSFVVAPCPHDSACPLLHDFVPVPSSSALKATKGPFHGAPFIPICSFPVRANVPMHARPIGGGGHKRSSEGTRYSYVAVARGHRPSSSSQGPGDAKKTKIGIIDALRAGPRRLEADIVELGDDAVRPVAPPSLGGSGQEESFAQAELAALVPEILAREAKLSGADGEVLQDALAQAQAVWSDSVTIADDAIEEAETQEVNEQQEAAAEALEASASFVAAATTEAIDEASGEVAQLLARARTPGDEYAIPSLDDVREEYSEADEAAMRREALTWPRLVRPPLKKGGHVTFDACMANGAIERYTLAKSVGRQPYHDARKATWGDAFPHLPTKGTSPRVAAAGEARSTISRQATKHGSKQINTGLLSSASAIGADIVAPMAKQRREETDRRQGRRSHYEDAGSREGVRSNRKRSLGDYEKEVAQAWEDDDNER